MMRRVLVASLSVLMLLAFSATIAQTETNTAYATYQVTVRDLVKASIEVKRLPPETLSDTQHLNVLDTKLADLNCG
jgi:hypothetical protein